MKFYLLVSGLLLLGAGITSYGSGYQPIAVTADGRVLHPSTSEPPPWKPDVLKHQWGDYPFVARSRRWQGTGWFRLRIAADGTVSKVTVIESTGYSILDDSATAAFLKWRFKPGKWKTIDQTMFFKLPQSSR